MIIKIIPKHEPMKKTLYLFILKLIKSYFCKGTLVNFFHFVEYVFIASYYRQLSVDIKMKNHKIKTGINIMILILIFIENCLKFDAVHEFSVWLRTGYNPEDSNRCILHFPILVALLIPLFS